LTNQQNNSPHRPVPMNDTHFNTLGMIPTYSNLEEAPALHFKTTKSYPLYVEEEGKIVTRLVELSSLQNLQMFKQDIRLGNLTTEEIQAVVYRLDLAYDCLNENLPEAGILIFERAISIIETSHSRKGWYRRLLGTIRTESSVKYDEPKKGFFGGKKNE